MAGNGGLVDSSLETLSRGRVVDQVNGKLAEALAHCAALPSLDKCREVTLTVSLKPALEDGNLVVNIASGVKLKLPATKGASDRAYFKPGVGFRVMEGESSEERQLDVVNFAERKAREVVDS